ncbi:MAG: ABC transporter substrate-binding protein [Pseudomonadota bacterium]
MEKLHIHFTLFSAAYSPLIAAMAGGFLAREGFDASFSVAEPGVSAISALESGEAQVIQTAPSQGFMAVSRGEVPTAVHFAQINEMDVFFISGRQADPDFKWHMLEDAEVITFSGGQPLAMFQYACHKAGISFDRVRRITVGGAAAMDAAFRDGQGAFIQQQGPFPQQLEDDGMGHVVAQSGPLIGPNAFSSVAATRDWLATDQAKSFTRAYAQARRYMNEEAASEIAKSQRAYFPKIDLDVLTRCITAYQTLGCWTPHAEITREAFAVAQEVFIHSGSLSAPVDYDSVCILPPG